MAKPSSSNPALVLDERGLPPHYPFRPDWEITPRQLRRELESTRPPVLIDCRTPAEWRIIRLPGARHVPLQQWLDPPLELEPTRDQPVVVYCHHGVRSLRMTLMLRQSGWESVRSLAGGIDLWALDIDPSMPRYP